MPTNFISLYGIVLRSAIFIFIFSLFVVYFHYSSHIAIYMLPIYLTVISIIVRSWCWHPLNIWFEDAIRYIYERERYLCLMRNVLVVASWHLINVIFFQIERFNLKYQFAMLDGRMLVVTRRISIITNLSSRKAIWNSFIYLLTWRYLVAK